MNILSVARDIPENNQQSMLFLLFGSAEMSQVGSRVDQNTVDID